jgi:hypothetical protein
MAEIELKVEVPQALEPKFERALERVTKAFIEELEISVARDILSKSKLTEEQARELGEEVKTGIAKMHDLL